MIKGKTSIGSDNHIYSFVSIGDDPQDKKYDGEDTAVEIGNRNSIREYTTINKGTSQDIGTTRLGDDNWIMAYVHIAHDCQVGNNTIYENKYYNIEIDNDAFYLNQDEKIIICIGKIFFNNNKISGVFLDGGEHIICKSLVLTTGTFLRGLIRIGSTKKQAGRIGDKPSIKLAETIERLKFSIGRLKTGTPPRILKKSINFNELEEQKPDLSLIHI